MLLTSAYAANRASVPTVRQNTTKFARRIKRGLATATQGATRFFRRNIENSFTPRSQAPAARQARLATSFLFSSGKRMANIPQVSKITILRLRAAQAMTKAERALNEQFLGNLKRRFNDNAVDWVPDHRGDMARVAVQHARYGNRPGFAF